MSGWGAWVRGDLDLCLVRFSPDYHYDAPREWLIAGMPSVYRGHARLREWFAELREAWEILDQTPLEVILIATGSEVSLAVVDAGTAAQTRHAGPARVVGTVPD
ncbi:MAG: hypothetical protein E6G49_05030 [Actinobacteria bacterium]|nr:MAG: hypothetical protein E6G49_05030 [Actinomycetota bacterium]